MNNNCNIPTFKVNLFDFNQKKENILMDEDSSEESESLFKEELNNDEMPVDHISDILYYYKIYLNKLTNEELADELLYIIKGKTKLIDLMMKIKKDELNKY